VNCTAFERWLDEGMPEAGAAEARSHAAGCALCAGSLAAAQDLEAGLMRAAFTAPATLTDAVMARVAAVEARRAVPVTAVDWRDAFPWWVRAACDPAAVAAMLLCGLLAWQWDAIARAGVAAAAWLGRANAGVTLPVGAGSPGLGMQIALAVILLPAAVWLGRVAFRASEKWVERAAGWQV
jgi:hypothetical protein